MDAFDPPHAITCSTHQALRAGDDDAANRLIEFEYGELQQIASRENAARTWRAHTQITGFVREVYLPLCGSSSVDWKLGAPWVSVFFKVAINADAMIMPGRFSGIGLI